MPEITTLSLIDLAHRISKAATDLQQNLIDNDLEQPSFNAGGRKDWHDLSIHPDILAMRAELVDTCQLMLNLALGPTDTLLFYGGPGTVQLEILRTITSLNLAQVVPLEGSIGLQDLATQVGVNQDLLSRQLKFAYLMGIFHEPEPNQVAHTSLSAALDTMAPYLRMRLSKLFFTGDHEMVQSMKIWQSPCPPDHIQIPVELADPQHRGMWKQLEEDDPAGKGMETFSAGMRSLVQAHTGNSYHPYIQGFEWHTLSDGIVIDVGGGNGHIPIQIGPSYPGLRFIVQDVPSNEPLAVANIREHHATGYVSFQAHDFFEPQPKDLQPKAYILSRVLHDWQDEQCIKLLQHLLPAMEEYGTKLLVSERLIPDGPDQMPNFKERELRMTDITMHKFYGARERSVEDWSTLFHRVDPSLTVTKVQRPPGTIFGMMEVELRRTC